MLCLGSLIAFCGFCFALRDCCVNSVVFVAYVCVFVLWFGVLSLFMGVEVCLFVFCIGLVS